MHARVSKPSPEGNPSGEPDPEISGASALLSARSAVILGASFLIAVCAGILAYLALGHFPADLAGAVLAGGSAFAGAVRLLMAIIALPRHAGLAPALAQARPSHLAEATPKAMTEHRYA